MAVGAFAAELIELGHQELGGLDVGHAVEVGHLVERALQRALRRRAVVADDEVDQRVVEHRSERIEQPADVMVGVLHERGVHLHLALQRRLERRSLTKTSRFGFWGRVVTGTQPPSGPTSYRWYLRTGPSRVSRPASAGSASCTSPATGPPVKYAETRRSNHVGTICRCTRLFACRFFPAPRGRTGRGQ